MSAKKTTIARTIVLTTLLGAASFCMPENSEAADSGKYMSFSSSLAIHQINAGIENPGAAMVFRWPWQMDKRPPEPPRDQPRPEPRPQPRPEPRPQPRPGWDRGPRPEPRPQPRPEPRPQPRPGWDRGPRPEPRPQPRPPIQRKDPPRPQPGDRPGPRPGDRGPGGPGPRW